jgi:hypothetical protein
MVISIFKLENVQKIGINFSNQFLMVNLKNDQIKMKNVFGIINVGLISGNEVLNFENRSYSEQFNYLNNLEDIEGNAVFEMFSWVSYDNLSANYNIIGRCYKVAMQPAEAMFECLLCNHVSHALVDRFQVKRIILINCECNGEKIESNCKRNMGFSEEIFNGLVATRND